MARTVHAPTAVVGSTVDNPLPRPQRVQVPQRAVSVESSNSGMHTTTSRQEMPTNGFRLIQNGRVRNYWTGRRPGLQEYIVKPDNNPVLGECTFFRDDGRAYIVRVTSQDIAIAESRKGWQYLTPRGCMEGVKSRVTFAEFLGNLYVANGVLKIQKIDFNSKSVEILEDSPRARYLGAFGNRLIAAYNGYEDDGLLPTNFAASAEGDSKIWSRTKETEENSEAVQSTVEENLVVSPSTAADAITGFYSISNVGVLLRERSIMTIERNPQAYFAPFRFEPFITDLGCDLPFGSVLTPQGIIFADTRTNAVYNYFPGNYPTPISAAIAKDRGMGESNYLFRDLADRYWTHVTFDHFEGEFQLALA